MELEQVKQQTTWNDAAESINSNNLKIITEVTKLQSATYKNKGYFTSLTALQSAFPSASLGSKAYVGAKYPYAIYLWQNEGWVNSGQTGGEENVNLSQFYTKEETDSKITETATTLDTKLTELSEEINGNAVINYYIDGATLLPDSTGRKALSFNAGKISAKFLDLDGVLNVGYVTIYLYDDAKNFISQHSLTSSFKEFNVAKNVAYIGIYLPSSDIKQAGQLSIELQAEGTNYGVKGDIVSLNGKVKDLELNDENLENQVKENINLLNDLSIEVRGVNERNILEYTSIGVKTAFSSAIPKGRTIQMTFTPSKAWKRFAVWYGASWSDAQIQANNSDLIADNVVAGEVIEYVAKFDITEIKAYLISADDTSMTIECTLKVPGGIREEIDDLKNTTIGADDILGAIGKSVNLFNPNDADALIGYYDAGTKIVQNADYNVTGFIPIVGDKTYQLLPSDAVGTKFARFITFYDANKIYISKIFSNVAEVTAPTNAVYMRVSYFTDTWVKAQVTEGTEPQPYEPYRLVISQDYLPTDKADLEYFFLPKDIYVASGRTIELYYSQILLNYQKYNIKAQCSIGASLERKFQIKGNDAHIGNYPLTIFVYDDNGNILKSASSTIHIVDASVGNMSVLPIGDSLTNGKDWLAEVRNLSSNAVTFVGTRKTGYVNNSAIRHEGRSGGTCVMYNTDSTYTYADNGYGGVGADAATFDSSKSYAKGDFCKYGSDVYVFTTAHSGAWNTSHVRNISQSNPFWDWNNNKFSINHYKSFYGINYNAIMIFLGTNGISLTPETNENGALGIKTLVENIRKEDTTTPIIVVNTIYRSGQNGIGTQGNTDGYKAQSEFKFDADRKVMLLAKAVEDMIGDMENIYICPVGFTHDSQYNFGNVKKEVNPRLTDTSEVFELFPLDSVHPQLEGYLQMADEMYSTICAL